MSFLNLNCQISEGLIFFSGAFSRVVLATNKTTRTEYAVKIVDKEETNAKDMYKGNENQL